jgi:LysM repeat protein
MSKWPASWRVILISVFCCFFSGCLPVSDTPADDEKDPNVIEGRKMENMMDWKGAVEAYERAIQANPRNATAHFNVAVLYDQRMHNPLAAAYHYQTHLELRPNSGYTEAIKPRLIGCKMEIAKTVTFGVVNEQVHRDLAKLTNDLAVARQQNDALRAQLAAKPTVVTNYLKYFVTNWVYVTNALSPSARPVTNTAIAQTQRAATNTTARVTPLPPMQTNAVGRTEPRTVSGGSQASRYAQSRLPAATRTYVVRAGETMAEVARRNGVSLQKLMAANSSIDPKRMKPGQTLNIPSQ